MAEAGTVLFSIMSRSCEVYPKGLFPMGKAARARNVEFYLHPTICLHGVVLGPRMNFIPLYKELI
jgi:hypothetical protein